MGAEMDIDKPDIKAFLSTLKAKVPSDLKESVAKFEDFYERKLWHQLTVALEFFFSQSLASPFLTSVCEKFICDFERKCNQLKLVQFWARAAKELKDPKKALVFLAPRCSKLSELSDSKDAYVLAIMETAHYKLMVGDYEGCKAAMEECEKVLDDLVGHDPAINANFYRVSADYYKTKADYPQYYKNALLFLSSVSLEELSQQEKEERAFDLALSALLGQGVYNFGELLMHPILDTLNSKNYSWLRDLLFAFNTGNIDSYTKISREGPFLQNPLLVSEQTSLSEKLCLMTLVESVFKRSKEERGRLRFDSIAKETRVKLDEVEHLVMKALSLGLLKGKLDEVEKLVEITWVQPRVLDRSQIATIMGRLTEWSKKVKQEVTALELEGGLEMFVQ